MTTSIAENICKVLETPLPETNEELVSIVRRASRSPEEIWEKFAPQAQEYLETVRVAVRHKKKVELPHTDPVIEEPEEDDESGIPDGLTCTTTTSNYTVEVLVNKFVKNQLKAPAFQRKFVWSPKRQAGFIESLLIGLPVPSVMFASESIKDDQIILDGFQRLSTILAFFKDELAIDKTTTFFTDYIGKTYSELPIELQKRFLRREIAVMEVRSDRDHWPHIFGRLNKGSLTLSPMEIRRATYSNTVAAPLLDTLEEIAEYHEMFVAMFGRNDRYGGLQALLRAVAMHSDYENYTKGMDGFLNNYCASFERIKDAELRKLKKRIDIILNALYEGCGTQAFRFESTAGKRNNSVNLGLVDCMFHAGFLFLDSEIDDLNDVEAFGDLMAKVRTKILNDQSTSYALKNDTSGRQNVIDRMSFTGKLVANMVKYRESRASKVEKELVNARKH